MCKRKFPVPSYLSPVVKERLREAYKLQGWLSFAAPVMVDWSKVGKVMPQLFMFGGVTAVGEKVLYNMAEMVTMYHTLGANLLY